MLLVCITRLRIRCYLVFVSLCGLVVCFVVFCSCALAKSWLFSSVFAVCGGNLLFVAGICLGLRIWCDSGLLICLGLWWRVRFWFCLVWCFIVMFGCALGCVGWFGCAGFGGGLAC